MIVILFSPLRFTFSRKPQWGLDHPPNSKPWYLLWNSREESVWGVPEEEYTLRYFKVLGPPSVCGFSGGTIVPRKAASIYKGLLVSCSLVLVCSCLFACLFLFSFVFLIPVWDVEGLQQELTIHPGEKKWPSCHTSYLGLLVWSNVLFCLSWYNLSFLWIHVYCPPSAFIGFFWTRGTKLMDSMGNKTCKLNSPLTSVLRNFDNLYPQYS